MAVASHLGIRLDEYDARIRSFIPDYETMLTAATQSLAAVVGVTPHVIDLGTGTGALAAACLDAVPGARLTIVDEDPQILEIARQRLAAHGDRVTPLLGNFVDLPVPSCEAVVGSLTFHHIRTTDAKRHIYNRFHDALSDHGVFVSVDCYPSLDPHLAVTEHAAWRRHLRETYSESETDAYFAAWASEDVYMPLTSEFDLLREARFAPDVVWRRGAFAVIIARSV
jgi:spermidine synthase